MSRRGFAILSVLPLGLLAACANMPIEVASAPPPMLAPAPPVAQPVAPDRARALFIAEQREEARRLEGTGALSTARQRWRYVLALLPDDAEARQQIARLDGLIRTRRAAGCSNWKHARRFSARTARICAHARRAPQAWKRRKTTAPDR